MKNSTWDALMIGTGVALTGAIVYAISKSKTAAAATPPAANLPPVSIALSPGSTTQTVSAPAGTPVTVSIPTGATWFGLSVGTVEAPAALGSSTPVTFTSTVPAGGSAVMTAAYNDSSGTTQTQIITLTG
jgi:hypothetical protein